jgi:hypothetical protein
VKNYIAGGGTSWNKNATAWYYIAAPVVDQNIADAMEAAFPNGQAHSDFDLYRWSEAQDTWINYHNTTVSPTFDRTVFKSGEGYIFGAPASVTLSLSGELGSGYKTWNNLSHSGTGSTLPPGDPNFYTSGWHLLGNPFPSGIVRNENWSYENIVHTPKVWNNGVYDDIAESSLIPANTAFFVQVVSSTYHNNNSLTIPSSARAHEAPSTKSTPQNRILLVAQAQGSEMRQQHVIRLEPDAAEGFDPRYDSRFMAGYAPQLFSITATDRLSTIAIPEITDELVIPMVFRKNNEEGIFLIKLERNIPGTDLYLHELKTDMWHELDFDKAYAFTADPDDDPIRFELHFSPPSNDDDDDGDGDDGDPTGITETTDRDATRMWYHNNRLYIQTTETGTQLTIYDINGRALQTYRPEPGLQSYHINLPPGAYIARLTGNDKIETLKIPVF